MVGNVGNATGVVVIHQGSVVGVGGSVVALVVALVVARVVAVIHQGRVDGVVVWVVIHQGSVVARVVDGLVV